MGYDVHDGFLSVVAFSELVLHAERLGVRAGQKNNSATLIDLRHAGSAKTEARVDFQLETDKTKPVSTGAQTKKSTRSIPDQADARELILAGARRHFFANGFRRGTMDELAQQLGMSKKTLYACFKSKHELLRAIILKKLGEADADFSSITNGAGGDFAEDLRRFLDVIHRNAQEITPQFVRDMHREPPEFFELIQTRRHDMICRYFQQLLERGRKQGIVRDDIPLALVIEIVLAAVGAILVPAKMMELNLTPRAGFAGIIEVVMQGVLVSKTKSARGGPKR
jgi:AcrR family transcriptional regulator